MTHGTDIMRDLFLALAEELCGAVADMVETANRLIEETHFQVELRDRVMIGLALKMESSFRGVIDDARGGRGEAMHHLKTMVESFLYLQLVMDDASDTTARQLITEVCYQKQKFLADNPEYAQSQATPTFGLPCSLS
jgi:hypothetical protein